jgi:ABC-type glycerol-3-phosphate transport system substrate-binding protein
MPVSSSVFPSRRSFLRGCGLALAASLLAACSPTASSPNPAPTAPPATSPPAATPAAAPTAAPAGAASANLSGEVTFSDPASLQAGSGDVIKRLFAAFQQTYPNVTVRDASLPFAQYNNQILTQIQSGSPPDVIHVDDTTLPVFIKNGYLAPLDSYLKNANLDPSTFIPAQAPAEQGGVTYAVVTNSNPRIYIYNKAIYDAAGVQTPFTGEDALNAAVKGATNSGSRQYGYGLSTKAGDNTGIFLQLTPLVFGMGGAFMQSGAPTANSAEVVAAMDMVNQWWTNNQIPRNIDAVASNTLFGQAKSATTINGIFVLTAADASVQPQLATMASPFPNGVNMTASGWYAVPVAAQHKELGARLVIQSLQPATQQDWILNSGMLPARYDAIQPILPQLQAKGAYWNDLVELGYHGKIVSYVPDGAGDKVADVMNAVVTGYLDMLYNGKSAAQAMNDVQTQLQQLLA